MGRQRHNASAAYLPLRLSPVPSCSVLRPSAGSLGRTLAVFDGLNLVLTATQLPHSNGCAHPTLRAQHLASILGRRD